MFFIPFNGSKNKKFLLVLKEFNRIKASFSSFIRFTGSLVEFILYAQQNWLHLSNILSLSLIFKKTTHTA